MQGDDALMRYRVRDFGSGVWGWAWLPLLGALLAGYCPQPAEAEVTVTQITNTTGSSLFYQSPDSSPSINADGTRIAFNSWSNLTGGNPDGSEELFLWTQGSGFTQITNSSKKKP